jgi:hypothetical protein
MCVIAHTAANNLYTNVTANDCVNFIAQTREIELKVGYFSLM